MGRKFFLPVRQASTPGSLRDGCRCSDQTNLTNSPEGHDSAPDWQTGVRWPASTPTGSIVTVQLGSVSVSFSNVSVPGTTSQIYINPATAGPLPPGYSLGPGLPAYEITTTAVYSPPVFVCLQVPSVTNPGAFNALTLFHNENGVLVESHLLAQLCYQNDLRQRLQPLAICSRRAAYDTDTNTNAACG
jgi:hypothetical protein